MDGHEAVGLRPIEEGGAEIKGGDWLVVARAGGDVGASDDGLDIQQALEGHGAFEHEAVVAEPVAVVGGVDDVGVGAETLLLERGEDAADRVIDQGDLPVGVGDDFAQVGIAQLRQARVLLADGFVLGWDVAFERGAVPPGAGVELARAVLGQVDVFGTV